MFFFSKAPFNQWHLREDYKRVNRRKELAESMKTYIIILGCINLVLMPVILLWQILYSFFNYAQIIKREPGSLGIRKWSLYGRYYLRSVPGCHNVVYHCTDNHNFLSQTF